VTTTNETGKEDANLIANRHFINIKKWIENLPSNNKADK
jgi:hypothetical protein